MDKEPETYEELIRKKRCIDLTNYYDFSMEELNQIYDFLSSNPEGTVVGGTDKVSLCLGTTVTAVIAAKSINSSIDGFTMKENYLRVIPHYTPSSSYSYSGGSSSNNNNNNNHNHNNNN